MYRRLQRERQQDELLAEQETNLRLESYNCTARRIRSGKNPLGKTIPILALTANAFLEDMQKSKDAGMNEHLSKPVDIATLEQMVRRFCKKP